MTTFVGNQEKFIDAVKDLIELDYDAVEAYETAINRLENKNFKSKLKEFKEDHLNHIKELSKIVHKHGEKPPSGPSMKKILTMGKVVLANIVGDNTILKAMLDNEQDTNKAYQRMVERKDQWNDIKDILSHGAKDEKKHKSWLEENIVD